LQYYHDSVKCVNKNRGKMMQLAKNNGVDEMCTFL
jgi:hypothetical protein